MYNADIGIIGGGVVGCAIARHLGQKYATKSIVVIEKHGQVCMETSRFNSGVNHSGFHQQPGSLKATLAFQGSHLMRKYVEENLPPDKYSHCGMLIAISGRGIFNNIIHDVSSLTHLLGRGRKQGIEFRTVGPKEVKNIEPNIKALGGIFIPGVSVIDQVAVTESFRNDAISCGVQFFFNCRVKDIFAMGDGYWVGAENQQEFHFKTLINAAGLYADDIAALAGINKYRIYPWRGEYYELVGLPEDYVRTLVYPAVSKNSPGKGIHFRPLMNGKVLIGPSAMPVDSKNDYTEGRYPKEVFLNAARKFFPGIGEDNLVPSYAGIRPKLRAGGEEDDFIISLDRTEPFLINLVGIESPGLSSSMAIAEYVGNLTDGSIK